MDSLKPSSYSYEIKYTLKLLIYLYQFQFKTWITCKTNGFFIESGALDGEFQSSTIYMERFFNWSGVLIESGRASFHKLKSRNRKAYALPVCLSPVPYPIEVIKINNYNRIHQFRIFYDFSGFFRRGPEWRWLHIRDVREKIDTKRLRWRWK